VAELAPGEYRVIEVNFSGFHPCFEPGFHCSGFFQDDVWGPLAIARLIRHVERHYGVVVSCAHDSQMSTVIGRLYIWIARWHQILRVADLLRTVEDSIDSQRLADADLNTCPYEAAGAVFIPLVKRLAKTCALLDS
jgi:hypothetical protein